MRTLLFRGQTRRYGERVNLQGERMPSRWVYGGITQGPTYSIIYGSDDLKDDVHVDKYTVYSDTVGQYTGTMDGEGTRVFEGDILSIEFELDDYPSYGKVAYENAKVVFSDTKKGWVVVFSDDTNMPIDEYIGYFKVIGNIYDNPELMEER